jgi:peroxiredoxin
MEAASMRRTRLLPLGVLIPIALVAAVAGWTADARANAGERGAYLSPLVPLQRLDGQNTHLHVDEVRLRPDGLLLQCSYTFGVVDARDAGRLRYLAQNLTHAIPGDRRRPGCVHLAWDGDVVYTTHRGNIRNPAFLTAWDITDREQPVQLPALQEPGVSYEGVDVANGRVFVGLHEKGLGIYERAASNELTRVGTLTGLTNAWGVRAAGNTVFVADGIGGLATVDVTTPAAPRILGRVVTGGQARDVVVAGPHAYVASGSAGLVVVDVSDLTNPTIVGTAAMPGTALRLDYSAGRVFVAAWNDARVYDVSVPSTPRFVGAVRLTRDLNVPEDDRPAATSRILGIAARDQDVFIGNWHQLYSYRLYPDRVAPSLRLPEAAGMVDFGPVAPGGTRTLSLPVTNQGTAPLTVFSANVAGEAFTVEPAQAQIAPGATARLSLTYRAAGTARQEGYLRILSDDPGSPLRTAFLVGNQPGLGVNMPLPETTGVLLDGTDWSSSQAAGRVLLLNFFATFCPVCGGQLPDVEARFWQTYRDQGLVVVALNAHDGMDRIGEVDQYVDNLRLTFALGLEQSTTYRQLTQNFAGANPFPVDVIVGKDGRIAYIAREYDPDAMTEVIERLLAE